MIDGRVGYFTNKVRNYDNAVYDKGECEFISRWKLVPHREQLEAYLGGDLVEPIKPIVF